MVPTVYAAWSDPDELHRVVVTAMGHDFVCELEPAARRLVEIDPIPERAYTVLGTLLMRANEHAAAEQALEAGMRQAGRTPTLLCKLAMAIDQGGDQPRAQPLLKEAIGADPNHDLTLQYWLMRVRERTDEAGYQRALEEVTQLAGAWRPQLYLARLHIESGRVDRALEIYRALMAAGLYGEEGLVIISADLGVNGHVALIPELIGPYYNMDRDHPQAGLNLLRAYAELRQHQEGKALLMTMYQRDCSEVRADLDFYAAQFGAPAPA